MTTTRVFNFAAGPAVLPVPVLEQIQRDLLALPGVGMSILEISHRSKTFESILAQAEADIRALAGIPDELPRAVPAGRRQPAVLDGADEPARRRARRPTTSTPDRGRRRRSRKRGKSARVNVAASTKAEHYARIPGAAEMTLTPGAAYVHMTSNNTIEGTEWKAAAGGRRRAARQRHVVRHVQPADRRRAACAHLRRRAEEHGAGRRDPRHHPRRSARALGARRRPLPTMLNYAVHAENKSLYNTPPVFAIYALGLVMKWLLGQGGLAGIAARQRAQGREALRRDRPHRLLSRHGAARTAGR